MIQLSAVQENSGILKWTAWVSDTNPAILGVQTCRVSHQVGESKTGCSKAATVGLFEDEHVKALEDSPEHSGFWHRSVNFGEKNYLEVHSRGRARQARSDRQMLSTSRASTRG